MINKFSCYSIQFFLLFLKTTSNHIQPHYPMKVLNTENVILSLGDADDDTNYDLEIIKNHPENSLLEKKLYSFHKYINLAEKTETPKERRFKPYKMRGYMPMYRTEYPDSPYEIAADERQLRMLERRKRRKKNKKRKKLRMKRMAAEYGGDKPGYPDVEDIELEYDYMEKEYLDYLARSQKNRVAFKYSDEGRPEESVKDVVMKIIDVRVPKNCTNITGIGVQAVECIIKNYREGVFNKEKVIYRLSFLALMWIFIYLAIALPLWCCKGWCCCCCRCGFCFPKKRVKDIQKYVWENPPGTIKTSSGKQKHYIPSQREIELYERIKRSIAEF